MVEIVDLQIKYKLTPSMAKALLLLLTNKIVTHAMLEVEHDVATDGKVLIHRTRRRLAHTAIKIKSQRDVGYWLDAESKEILRRDIESAGNELPSDHGGNSEEAPSLAA